MDRIFSDFPPEPGVQCQRLNPESENEPTKDEDPHSVNYRCGSKRKLESPTTPNLINELDTTRRGRCSLGSQSFSTAHVEEVDPRNHEAPRPFKTQRDRRGKRRTTAKDENTSHTNTTSQRQITRSEFLQQPLVIDETIKGHDEHLEADPEGSTTAVQVGAESCPQDGQSRPMYPHSIKHSPGWTPINCACANLATAEDNSGEEGLEQDQEFKHEGNVGSKVDQNVPVVKFKNRQNVTIIDLDEDSEEEEGPENEINLIIIDVEEDMAEMGSESNSVRRA
ncbi:MAG: hypothetical protein Q9170_006379 [Blastenia crenularia]